MNILVTGAAGFLGRELTSQLLNKGHFVVGVTNSESKTQEINFFNKHNNLKVYNMDISTSKLKLSHVMRVHNIEYVIHAAAMKHVRICEENPTRAIEVNIIGTKNIIEASLSNNIENIIVISTDKATNPSCVYGMTKHFTEKMLLEYNFSVFQGVNFFFSTGSVLDIWEKQRSQLKPISVSERNMIRYFVPVDHVAQKIISSLDERGKYIFNDKCYRIALHDLATAYKEYHSYHKQEKYNDLSYEKLEEEIFYDIEVEESSLKTIKNLLQSFYDKKEQSTYL